MPSSCVHEKLLRMLNKEQFPYVILGEPAIRAEELTWVDVDNQSGSWQATMHLFEQGYQKVAFVTENQGTVFAQNREKGYYRAIEDQGNGQPIILNCRNDYKILPEALEEQLKTERPDAFLCANNVIAYHVLKYLKQKGLAIPQQVGIVTFDNYPLAEYMDPPLSAVDVDTFQLGRKATELLIGKISRKEKERKTKILEVRLLFRESSCKGGK